MEPKRFSEQESINEADPKELLREIGKHYKDGTIIIAVPAGAVPVLARALGHYLKKKTDYHNTVQLFVDEQCCIGAHQEESSKRLYSFYLDWCISRKFRPIGRNHFIARLESGWGLRRVLGGGQRKSYFKGIAMNPLRRR